MPGWSSTTKSRSRTERYSWTVSSFEGDPHRRCRRRGSSPPPGWRRCGPGTEGAGRPAPGPGPRCRPGSRRPGGARRRTPNRLRGIGRAAAQQPRPSPGSDQLGDDRHGQTGVGAAGRFSRQEASQGHGAGAHSDFRQSHRPHPQAGDPQGPGVAGDVVAGDGGAGESEKTGDCRSSTARRGRRSEIWGASCHSSRSRGVGPSRTSAGSTRAALRAVSSVSKRTSLAATCRAVDVFPQPRGPSMSTAPLARSVACSSPSTTLAR